MYPVSFVFDKQCYSAPEFPWSRSRSRSWACPLPHVSLSNTRALVFDDELIICYFLLSVPLGCSCSAVNTRWGLRLSRNVVVVV